MRERYLLQGSRRDTGEVCALFVGNRAECEAAKVQFEQDYTALTMTVV